MAHDLKWDDLQLVLAVAEHRSLSGAARTIGVNHSTVLRRIEALESQTGLTMFDRPPGGYRLRPEAREMLPLLRAMAVSAARVERALAAVRLGKGGTFRITTTDSIGNVLLPRLLKQLRMREPDIEIEVIVSNQPLDLSRPEAEITIRPAVTLPEGLRGVRAGSMAFRVYGTSEYLAANNSEDPARHKWIGAAAPLTRSPVGQWQERQLPNPPLLRADSFPTMARMAAEGAGLAMLPMFVANSEAALVQAAGFPDCEPTSIWVAAHSDLANVPQIADLIEFFAEAIRSQSEDLEGEKAHRTDVFQV